MKRVKKIFTGKFWQYTGVACFAVAFYVLLCNFAVLSNGFNFIWKIVKPIILGVVVAYLFNPVTNFFERTLFVKLKSKSKRHIWSVITAAICFLLVIVLLLVALVPSMAQSISNLIANWNSYTQKADGLIEKVSVFAEAHNLKIDLSSLDNFVDNSMDRIIESVKNNSKTILTKLGAIGTGISEFALGLVYGFCFLLAKDTLLGIVKKIRSAIFKKEKIQSHNELLAKCNSIFLRYIGCTLLDALIVGTATLIFNLIAKVPYAPLIAVVVAITNIIPTFGPMIGSAIGVFFIILENPLKALIFYIFLCVLQSIDGMVIKPKLFKGTLGLPVVWTLILIIVGGKIAGMLGIILAVPFGAIFIIIYNQTIEPYLERRMKKINATEAPPENNETEKTD